MDSVREGHGYIGKRGIRKGNIQIKKCAIRQSDGELYKDYVESGKEKHGEEKSSTAT